MASVGLVIFEFHLLWDT